MKQLILLKQSGVVQLAHLYEHIFCSQLDTFLRSHNLYQHLDYSIDGKSYSGIVYIEIDLYTNQAKKHISHIATLDIGLNEDVVLVAVNQILAEKQVSLGGADYSTINKALSKLDKQPWQSLDDLNFIDKLDIQQTSHPFYIAEGEAKPSKEMRINLVLDKEITTSHRELLPLYQQLSHLIRSNLVSDLCDEHGYYSVEDSFKLSSKEAVASNFFRVGRASVNLEDICNTIVLLVDSMKREAVFNRFAAQLQEVNYLDWQNIAPNAQKIYVETGIFIGTAGWQRVATKENCELLLNHTMVEVKFETDAISKPLTAK